MRVPAAALAVVWLCACATAPVRAPLAHRPDGDGESRQLAASPAPPDDRCGGDVIDDQPCQAGATTDPDWRWKELAALHVFAMGTAGISGHPPLAMHLTAVLAREPDAVERFDRVVATGTPAARLYAVWALMTLDPPRASWYLAVMVNDRTPVGIREGCVVDRATVGEMAAWLTTAAAPRLWR